MDAISGLRKVSVFVTAVTGGGVTVEGFRELQRLLQVLDALIGLHLTAEEELLAHVEDLPAARPPDLRQRPDGAGAVNCGQ